MKKYIKLYGECIRISIAGATAYRADFFLGMVISLFSNLLFPLITVLVYRSGASFPGWTFEEVILIQAIFNISLGLSDMLFEQILWITMSHVQDGTFEIILIKPVDPLFFMTASSFSLSGLGTIVGGIAMFLLVFPKIHIVGWGGRMTAVLLFLAGLFVMMGIRFIISATSFKWIGNSRLTEIEGSIREFGKYPQAVFPKAIQIVTSIFLPVAMVGFFPANYLLGRSSGLLVLISVPCCLLFAMFGMWLYRSMIRQYEGAGA